MYLFSRQAHLVGGNGMAGVEWATEIAKKCESITGREVQLWASVYSPLYGTIGWTAWFEDLAALESFGDKLLADPSYNELAMAGADFVDDLIDDNVASVVHGEVDAARTVEYVGSVRAVIAAGSYARALGAGVEIAEKFQAVTGIPGLFLTDMTGPYGSVGWLTGYTSIAELQASNDALAADLSWIGVVDSTKGCFAEDTAVTQSVIWRRLG